MQLGKESKVKQPKIRVEKSTEHTTACSICGNPSGINTTHASLLVSVKQVDVECGTESKSDLKPKLDLESREICKEKTDLKKIL